jgi:glycosyltransferase involved in cell wall biosynthesis
MFLGKVINQFYLLFFRKRWSYRHSILISRGYARHFSEKLKTKKFDYIIAPAASCELAFLNSDVPIIYITDGTFAGCLNYHKSLSNLTKRSIKEGNLVEKFAIAKCRHLIVSSKWAANSALKDYQCAPEKLHVLPYGANFEKVPASSEINYSIPSTWKILFPAVYWEDKGGEIAWNAFKILTTKFSNIELTVLGCEPPEYVNHPGVKKIPFIDKNSPQGMEKLTVIFKQHHFMILPTRFDCTPIVINEASAFGIPCLVARTGGVEGHLEEGVNGFTIDYNDIGEGYATKIEEIIQSPNTYLSLAKSTRKAYEERLNWDSWREQLKKVLGINS